MKTIILSILIFASAATAPAMVALPPNIGTNDLALYSLASRVSAMEQRNAYRDGRQDRLEREMDRVETGFLLLIIFNVSVIVALCLLTARDKARNRPPKEDGSDLGPDVIGDHK